MFIYHIELHSKWLEWGKKAALKQLDRLHVPRFTVATRWQKQNASQDNVNKNIRAIHWKNKDVMQREKYYYVHI